MKDLNKNIFTTLFREAYKKCFGIEITQPLSETESKHLSNKILEETGLVIGAKSIKNYSSYILHPGKTKEENPSVATLDTLARYLLNAPYIDEIKRKDSEAHNPYWFEYRNKFSAREKMPNDKPALRKTDNKKTMFFISAGVITAVLAYLIVLYHLNKNDSFFVDDFHNVQEDSLFKKGWLLKDKDEAWWSKRNEMSSHLTLFTLRGDNWSDSLNAPSIKNLMVRKISADCFIAEIHLDNFVPLRKWQQAGILLLEDTNFSSKSLRLSIAYNDFFGGFNRPKEIILQAITSDANNAAHPEEIIHLPLFSIQPGQDELVEENLHKSGLKIEKNGHHYRFLYATGQAENFAYKEALSKDLFIEPTYIGIFALGGFVNDTNYIGAHFSFFKLQSITCEN